MTVPLVQRVTDGVRRVIIEPGSAAAEPEAVIRREWLVTNGLGGYASGTIAGVATRRYHGLLVAALPNPLGRTMMLNRVSERLVFPDGTSAPLGGQERAEGGLELAPLEHMLRGLAGVVAFLASDDSNFMTGTYIPVDGGFILVG